VLRRASYTIIPPRSHMIYTSGKCHAVARSCMECIASSAVEYYDPAMKCDPLFIVLCAGCVRAFVVLPLFIASHLQHEMENKWMYATSYYFITSYKY